jgi:divalent metal cation (Fe/Co/Zn/Cd) transporter
MDGGSGSEAYKAVFEAVHSIPGAGHPHRTRMRRIAGLWDIDLDIEVQPNMTVLEAHWIAFQVERAIKERVEGVYDIMVHVEPAGNKEDEGYGLQEKDWISGTPAESP